MAQAIRVRYNPSSLLCYFPHRIRRNLDIASSIPRNLLSFIGICTSRGRQLEMLLSPKQRTADQRLVLASGGGWMEERDGNLGDLTPRSYEWVNRNIFKKWVGKGAVETMRHALGMKTLDRTCWIVRASRKTLIRLLERHLDGLDHSSMIGNLA
ncbi:hypothetical protein F4824DRAFT_119030 [Ustulina deusta]|nr:hypothetical protein F4824DRAFT_119030 [Ustulina deusta]